MIGLDEKSEAQKAIEQHPLGESRVDFCALDSKWQEKWRDARLFEADVPKGWKDSEPGEAARKKYFVTFPYPYVNGAPHIGHAYSFLRTDAFARYKRMCGYDVLWTQGFHATGEPILGTIERLQKNDADQISTFKKYGVPDAELKNFLNGPIYVARFWMNRWIDDLNAVGSALDWRRKFITTTMTPAYSRFIEWQYNTLRKKGYVVQGTHPVIYCPHCKSPTGDHDRLKGEGESPVEFIVLKFKMEDGTVLTPATLRPETVFGVVNVWVNPGVEYVVAQVGGENWVLSAEAAGKLKEQQKKVSVVGKVAGKDLVGRKCVNPVTGEKVLVLPAAFVDPANATGVVMSVPAHAPYDYVALEDLKKNDSELKKYGLDAGEVRAIRPVSLIEVPGFGEFPAVEASRQVGAASQKDGEKLEKATSLVYKSEFHKGVLKKNCGKYAGVAVGAVKKELSDDLKKEARADSIWECTNPVVCRCTTQCFVKVLENQWFLKFGDEEWKVKARRCLGGMKLVPEEVRTQFENTVEWLENKACARRSGLGTPIPWDQEWIVETLSDSTIYMAYYTIARIVNERKLEPKNLPDALFDYVFNEEGTLDDAEAASGLKKDVILEMKKEFDYFYPVDMRNSAVELVQNHLTFFIFHHTALFREKHWPKGISVNGWVQVEGEKMSKSKGNIFPMADLVKEYGADVFRLNIITSSEGLSDADWKFDSLKSNRRLLEFLFDVLEEWKKADGKEAGREEKLLASRVNSASQKMAAAYEELRFRAALTTFSQLCDSIRRYLSRTEKPNRLVLGNALQAAALMICPVAPHAAEELWEKMGGKGFASSAAFPKCDDSSIDAGLEEEEKYLESLCQDVRKVLEVTKNEKPAKISFVAAASWKRELVQKAVEEAAEKFDFSSLMKEAMARPELKARGKQVESFLKGVSKTVNFYKEEGLPKMDEYELLCNQKEMLEKTFGCAVEVFREEDAEKDERLKAKAEKAAPFKPALLIG